MTNNENSQNTTSNPILDNVFNVNPKQIKADILMFKNEILKDIKTLSRNLTEKYEASNEVITQKIEAYELKINLFNQKIAQLSNEIVTDKALKEKITKLIDEKETMKNNISSNEFCIKSLEKNLYKDITNLNNILNDTVIYPTVVGPMGKFKSYHGFIDYIIQQLAITSKYREKNTLDLSQYKNKLETLISSFKIQLDNLLNNCNQFTTKSVNECEERMKKLMLIYDDRLQDTRVENANYAVGLEKTCDDLKNELKNIDKIKEDIYTKMDNEVNFMKKDNEKVYEKFIGYKKEFQFFKDKLSQISEWIKDVRFRVNVGQEIKRKEFYNMANQIDFSKRYGKFKNEGGLQYENAVRKNEGKSEEIDLIKRQLGVGQYNLMDSIDYELKNNNNNKRKSMNSLILCSTGLKRLQHSANIKNNVNSKNEKDKNYNNSNSIHDNESNSVEKNMRKSSVNIFTNFTFFNNNKNDLLRSNSINSEEGEKVNTKNVIKEEEEYNSKESDDLIPNDEYKSKSNKNSKSKRNSKNENILLKLNGNSKEEKKELKKELNKDIINNINDKSNNLNASIKEENTSNEIIKNKIDFKANKNRAKSSNITSNTVKDKNAQIDNMNILKPSFNSIDNSEKNKQKNNSIPKQSAKISEKSTIVSKNKDNSEIKSNSNSNNSNSVNQTLKNNLNKIYSSKSSNDIKITKKFNNQNKNNIINNITCVDNKSLNSKKIISSSNSSINQIKENFGPKSDYTKKFNSTNFQFGNNINNKPPYLLYSPEDEKIPKLKYIKNDIKGNEANNIQKMVNNLQNYLPINQHNFIMDDNQRHLYNRQGLYSSKNKNPHSAKKIIKFKENIIQIQMK